MYVDDFESFAQQAEELYRARPVDTRYTVKYRHSDGKLVLKVTDDRVCLKFRTDQQVDLKKLERLNSIFFALMARGDVSPADLAALTSSASAAAESSQAPATTAAAGGAGKGGKKGGKRKG